MRFPKLNVRPQSREFIQEFSGLDRRTRILENCFAEMKNLTGDFHPALAPRHRRGIIGTVEHCNALLAGERLAYVSGNTLYWGQGEDAEKMTLTAGENVPRQLVMMGAYLVVFPDNMYLNTADTADRGAFYSTLTSKDLAEFSFTLYDSEKDEPFTNVAGATFYYADRYSAYMYLKPAEYAFNYIKKEAVELTGVPNPGFGAFQDVFQVTVTGSAFEVVSSPGMYLKVQQCGTAEGAVGSVTVQNLQTGNIVVHTLTTVAMQDVMEIRPPYGYWMRQDGYGGSSKLYDSMNSGAEKEIALRIDSPLFSHYPNWKVKITLEVERGSAFLLPYVPLLEVDAEIRDGAVYLPGCLTGCLSFTTYSKGNSADERFTASMRFLSIVPVMDHVIESQNRLWGCRYGLNCNGVFVNEIYASALGDFRQWYTFAGISTDSYTATVGISGAFTGAINYRGFPLFFKENVMYKIYGDYPESYQIIADSGMGVQRGCDKSLFVLANVLYYKSPDGIFAYNGSASERIDAVLGSEHYTNVVCGGTGTKLWFSMVGETDAHSGIYVCDTEKGLWHMEDHTRVLHAARFKNDVYLATADGYLLTVNGSMGELEGDEVPFFAQTGIIGYNTPDSKYVSRLALRVSVPCNGSLRIFVEYDSANVWEFKGSIEGNGMRTFSIPVVPRMCDHFRIRLEGKGDCRIFGFSKVLEEGGAV